MAGHSTPQDTRALVDRYFALVTARDWEGLRGLFAADATLTHPAFAPMRGWNAMAPFYAGLPGQFPSYREYATNVIVEDARAAAELVFEATRANGEALTLHASDFFEFEGGLIKALTIYLDTGALRG